MYIIFVVCGTFKTEHSHNSICTEFTNIAYDLAHTINYIFRGLENTAPTEMERVQKCVTNIDESRQYDESDYIYLLDVNETFVESYRYKEIDHPSSHSQIHCLIKSRLLILFFERKE